MKSPAIFWRVIFRKGTRIDAITVLYNLMLWCSVMVLWCSDSTYRGNTACCSDNTSIIYVYKNTHRHQGTRASECMKDAVAATSVRVACRHSRGAWYHERENTEAIGVPEKTNPMASRQEQIKGDMTHPPTSPKATLLLFCYCCRTGLSAWPHQLSCSTRSVGYIRIREKGSLDKFGNTAPRTQTHRK